ncbi:MAG TPA: helix-turn-helix domain-containing protein [Terriglobales bacterium]|nr:helix-turn-helix domain-containing protein [Terriglobales bacterium]
MYSHNQLVQRALESLESKPALNLSQVANRLKIDRHTLQRAFNEKGLNFARLRRAALLAAIAMARAEPVPLSVKEIAVRVGFPSAGALSQFLRRHDKRGGGQKVPIRRILFPNISEKVLMRTQRPTMIASGASHEAKNRVDHQSRGNRPRGLLGGRVRALGPGALA